MADRSTSRRRLLGLGVGLGAVGLVGAPAGHLGATWLLDGNGEPPLPDGVASDASHLERHVIAERVAIHGTTDEATAQIQRALTRARSEGLPVSIAGARHTMGGHTIAPGGMQLDLARTASLSLEGETLRAGAGACWRDVLPFLDRQGRAVRVMQSNADFSLGGSLGANCHGWQPGCGPIASTVEAITMVLADGQRLRCSRADNVELFRHAIGGYGLVGVVVEVELRTTENVLVQSDRQILSLDEMASSLLAASDAELAFARLSIPEGDERFEEVLLTRYDRVAGEAPALIETPDSDLARLLFRGEIESRFGKSLRWLAERELGSEGGERCSRNQLMNEPVARFGNRRIDRTDVLFEGFVPPAAAAAYARRVREIVASHGVDLLNVTVRHVREDVDTVLRYAATEVLGFVMLFHHARTAAADAVLSSASEELVDAALALGGRYYLPYRSAATRAQFERAYPESVAFRDYKRRIDPDTMLQNRFFETYLR